MLTITVPKSTYGSIRKEAQKRKETISGLLRKAFDFFVQSSGDIYSNQELADLLGRDRLPTSLRKDLDLLLKQKQSENLS